MSLSSGSGVPAKKGGDWTYLIYFDPEADKSSGTDYLIEHGKLIETLNNLLDTDENIIEVCAYQVDLSSSQKGIANDIFHHLFIVFRTKDWYWSIEKNTEGITIQRSKILDAVQKSYRQINRNPGLKLVSCDHGKKSIKDLIQWLYDENELKKQYSLIFSNCQVFGKAVFNHVAQSKTL